MKIKWKQLGFILSPLGVLLIASTFWIYLLKPKLIDFIQSKIPEINTSQNYINLSFKDFDISFIKLQLGISQARIEFKESLSQLQPIEIKQVRLQIDPFKLLVGQFSISKLQLNQLKWNFDILNNDSTQPSKLLPLDIIFKILPQIPIDQVLIYNSHITLKNNSLDIQSQFNINQLSLAHRKNSINLSIKKLLIQSQNSQNNIVNSEFNLESRLDLVKNSFILELLQFNLISLDSRLSLSGQLLDFQKILIEPNGNLKIKSEIHFDDMRSIALSLFPQKQRFPAVTGLIKTEGNLNFKSLNNINGNFLIETKQVNVDHFKLGQAQIKAEIKKNQIYLNQIEVEHPSGLASFKEIEIEQKSPYGFKAKTSLNHFDLQKLFVSMGMNDIPAGMIADAEASCSGFLQPEFKVNCESRANLEDIWVKAEMKSNSHILKLKKAEILGQFNANLQKIEYKANLKVGQSVGISQGQVNFTDGFKLSFETDKLSFNDVESLADLNFKGDLKIKGTTSGNSSYGIIDAEAIFSNAEIDQFRLGRMDAKMKYEKSNLYLNQINGLLGKTTYQGDAAFDFSKLSLKSRLDLKKIYGEDLFFALNKRFYIPFNLTGSGSALIDVWGPLDFWKLNYDLKAQLNQGQIADESFDRLNFNLNANGKAVHFEKVSLKKNRTTVTLDGDILTDQKEPQFAVKIKAQPFYIEESDHVLKLAPNLTGQAWIEGEIKKDLLNPELSFNFSAKQINFENTDYPTSQGEIKIDRKNFKFLGQLFGRQIQSDLVWPWSENEPYSLKLQVRDLNPMILLPLISIPQPTDEYYSRLNADVDLKSNQRSLKTSEGSIKISDFMLQRGALYLKLAKPASLYFKNGLNQMDPIDFKGENNSLKMNYLNSKQNEVRLSVIGDLQLKQFQFLVPFSQSLAGRIQVDSQILLRNSDFELIGEGELSDGLVNLKGFPQAIENINTPIEFSKSKIILSDITALLGNSEIEGEGQIDIKGHHQINVNLQATAENIELMFPDQITTSGKADLTFFGSWLPYTLKVNYKVNHGLVEKDFGQDDSKNKTALKASPYLPPQQIELQTPSLLLDVAVDLTQGIIVKDKILEGEAFGKLQIKGTPENPSITGRIDIKPGSKLIFKDKAFDIQTATIQFPQGTEINPEIYLTANARVSDYDINLLVQGQAKNLAIKPTSQPPLSVPDIFSLLALGLTSSKLDQNLSSETQQQQTGLEIIASQVNQSQVNKKFQEKFGLTVQLTPTLDSTKNIAVPKVVVSKKIQKNVNASYSRPLTGDTQNQEWKLQYLFNPNKSVILNYQNNETNQQDQIRNSNTKDQGVLGLDFEYKKEFK